MGYSEEMPTKPEAVLPLGESATNWEVAVKSVKYDAADLITTIPILDLSIIRTVPDLRDLEEDKIFLPTAAFTALQTAIFGAGKVASDTGCGDFAAYKNITITFAE